MPSAHKLMGFAVLSPSYRHLVLLSLRAHVTLIYMKNRGQADTQSGADGADEAAARTRFEQLKRQEHELRNRITNFSGSNNLPRDELYRRGADDPTRPREK